MKIVDFRLGRYFSNQWLFVGLLLLVAGGILLLKTLVGGAILVLISVLIFTTHYRLSIRFNEKSYYDYVWVLGLKFGDRGTFEKIEYIFIKKSKISQTMNTRVSSSTIHKEVYDGYLKFSEENKIHLLTKGSKNLLIKNLVELSTKLNTKIFDYSEGEPIAITA
ncbi:MAG: hypothetical protein IPJ20_26785 [Flammeovirgaceae bacterium]|nr:hypothetical protein [Flammeovirgaceae bacterium]